MINRLLGFPAEEREQRRHVFASCLSGIVSQVLVPSIDGNGRVLASEVLINAPTVRSIINGGSLNQLTPIISQGLSDGMSLLGHDLLQLVRAGKISQQNAVLAAYEDLPSG